MERVDVTPQAASGRPAAATAAAATAAAAVGSTGSFCGCGSHTLQQALLSEAQINSISLLDGVIQNSNPYGWPEALMCKGPMYV